MPRGEPYKGNQMLPFKIVTSSLRSYKRRRTPAALQKLARLKVPAEVQESGTEAGRTQVNSLHSLEPGEGRFSRTRRKPPEEGKRSRKRREGGRESRPARPGVSSSRAPPRQGGEELGSIVCAGFASGESRLEGLVFPLAASSGPRPGRGIVLPAAVGAEAPERNGGQNPFPCATAVEAPAMSQRRSAPSLGDEALLLEHQVTSDFHLRSNGVSSQGKRGSLSGLDLSPFGPKCPPPPTAPRRIVLSTESPAALKLGTQQVIPKGLAEGPKAKLPARHESFTVGASDRDGVRCDPKRMSAPSISFDDLEGEDLDSRILKRNLRSMSYRAAMKGLGSDEEPPKVVSSLKPVSGEAVVQGARSPGRHKRTLGRKRMQRHGGSFKDDPRLYQEIREKGLNSISHESDDDHPDIDTIPEESPGSDSIIVVKNYRPAHVTWSQIPEVQETGILDQVSPEERKRQEAIFEIITSQYSYMRSLEILVTHFFKSEELKETMTQTDHHHLFSNIADIWAVSKSFFEDLEKRHQENVLIPDISDIVETHATHRFNPYVIYCSNEVYQQRTLQKLLTSNPAFKETLKHIEQKPECGSLPLISFLILPMQRVTRLPLLMDTVCQKTPTCSPAYEASTQALKALSKLVKRCNEGAHTMERTEQMYTLQKQLEFGKIKNFPLISASRWLLKRGELCLPLVEDGGIFRKGSGRGSCYLFLFNDVLIITRKKSEECYTVLNYAMLDQLMVEKMESLDIPSSPPGKPGSSGAIRNGHFFRVVLNKDSEGKREAIVLATETLSDRARWITALMHREEKAADTANKGDLKQVEITRAYMAKQTDEISLQQGDVVLVLAREGGWYLGERLRDGEKGWFPQTCAQEITNRSTVERNVQRMERLRIETDV